MHIRGRNLSLGYLWQMYSKFKQKICLLFPNCPLSLLSSNTSLSPFSHFSLTYRISLSFAHTHPHTLSLIQTQTHTPKLPSLYTEIYLLRYTRRHEHTPSNSITYHQPRRKRVFSQTKSENVRGSQDSY